MRTISIDDPELEEAIAAAAGACSQEIDAWVNTCIRRAVLPLSVPEDDHNIFGEPSADHVEPLAGQFTSPPRFPDRACPACGKQLPPWWKYDYCSKLCEQAGGGGSTPCRVRQ